MNSKGQAKLYYLYMAVDKEVSLHEMELFTSICEKLNIDGDEKINIISECEEISIDEGLSCLEVLKQNVKLGYTRAKFDMYLSQHESDNTKAVVLWNLINLGYADTCFTNAEREVINYLREYWEIKDSLYQEMIDVAETVLALEKYKKWIEENLVDNDKIKKLNQVDKDIKYVQDTIRITISELD